MESINVRLLPKTTIESVLEKLTQNSAAGTYPEPHNGYIVAIRSYDTLSECLNAHINNQNKDLSFREGGYIGWWTSPTGEKMYEFCIKSDQIGQAKLLGSYHSQHSIWDVKNQCEIVLKTPDGHIVPMGYDTF